MCYRRILDNKVANALTFTLKDLQESVANVRIFRSKYPALRMCIAINAHSKIKYSELDSRSSILAGYCDSVFKTSSMTMRIMKPLCDRYRVQNYSGLPKYRLLQHTVSRQSYAFFYIQHSCYSTSFGPKYSTLGRKLTL